MEARLRFVHDALSDRYTMSELCARYGVSRRVGYVWLARYEGEGQRGLVDRSHAPHHCPHKIPAVVADLLIAERMAHPFWGARKLLAVLTRRHPRTNHWPAPSTVADLLARRGLVQKRRSRRSPIHPAWCGRRRSARMICGPRTSKDSFAPAMAAIAIRSRSRISTPASCLRVVACFPRRR